MSADGKIADYTRSPVRFGSPADQLHLERQIAQVDGVLFGAGTLRAYGTSLRVRRSELLQQRQQRDQLPQPVQIVCSRSGNLDPTYPFFQQPLPRWLLTTAIGAQCWHKQPGFERILIAETSQHNIDWEKAFQQLKTEGLNTLAILGGGETIASLLAHDLIDELRLTICPLLLGGTTAPGLIAGSGFLADQAPRLELLAAEVIDAEVFLHYRLQR